MSEYMITGPMALVNTPGPAPLSDPDRSFVDHGLVAHGGTGEIRCVFDPRLLRKTALKRVDIRRNHPRDVARFIDEARVTGQLEHPNVVPIHEFGAARDGSLYISMKLVAGQTLAQIADEQTVLTPKYISDYISSVLRVCEALSFAHSKEVLHRDLKPENVIVGSYGQVYLLDWGVARVSPADATTENVAAPKTDDTVVGTPAYMSPEQAIGDPSDIDQRTDVFGVGTLLYYGISGRPPYGNSTIPESIFRAIAGDLLPVTGMGDGHVPASLTGIVNKALHRDPAKRFSTIDDLAEALQRFQRGTWSIPPVEFALGSAIITVGDPPGPAFVVSSGTVEAWLERNGSRVVLRTMGPGEVFGEMSHLTGGVRSANITALTDTTLLRVSEDTLNQGLGLNSWLGGFVRTLARRFRDIDAELRTLQLDAAPPKEP